MIARTVRHLQIVGEQTADGLDVCRGSSRSGSAGRETAPAFCSATRRSRSRTARSRPGTARHVERAIRSDQPFVAVMVRHVMRRQQHDVVARGVQRAVGAVDDLGSRQRHAALGAEIIYKEFVMLGRVRRCRRLRARRDCRGQLAARRISRRWLSWRSLMKKVSDMRYRLAAIISVLCFHHRPVIRTAAGAISADRARATGVAHRARFRSVLAQILAASTVPGTDS